MALYENVSYNANGKIAEGDFMQYKIPTRQDVGNIHVEFETSYEPSGPFGVKSIGEIVINTPAPHWPMPSTVQPVCGTELYRSPRKKFLWV